MAQSVAFIGLGAMGSGMARCLVRRGFNVRGYDIRGGAVAALKAAGGIACGSPAEAGEDVDAALVIVLTADQAEEVTFGSRGLAESLERGTPVICMSTMSPARTR
jgi:3-hydroxyisobutyrate dehydrogenase